MTDETDLPKSVGSDAGKIPLPELPYPEPRKGGAYTPEQFELLAPHMDNGTPPMPFGIRLGNSYSFEQIKALLEPYIYSPYTPHGYYKHDSVLDPKYKKERDLMDALVCFCGTYVTDIERKVRPLLTEEIKKETDPIKKIRMEQVAKALDKYINNIDHVFDYIQRVGDGKNLDFQYPIYPDPNDRDRSN